ncbi:MAG TPA: DNA cytosine methyltransferase [Bacteroidia bacterium]|nr:DNA cytosine methyltransferase [Bacteroidia bacterium]
MYNILSIFTGAGGFDVGFHGGFKFLNKSFKRTKFRTHTSLDFNRHAVRTVKEDEKYFKGTTSYCENIIEFDSNKIKEPKLGFDVLLGGFPCLQFSTQGKRHGIKDDISGKLYLQYCEYVDTFQPKIFIAENVKGILSANSGDAIKIITKRFEDTGYTVSVHLVNFANYGVPQLRERVLFIGVRKDLIGEFKVPKFTNTALNYISSGRALNNIEEDANNNELNRINAKTIERINAIPPGGNFKDLPKELSVKGMMSNIYRRLDKNKPGYTITASGGGGTMGYHFDIPRALTNRERARLQGFPDDFVFKGSLSECRRQIGNAVPPVGIYPFAKEVQRILDINK